MKLKKKTNLVLLSSPLYIGLNNYKRYCKTGNFSQVGKSIELKGKGEKASQMKYI